jgi:predicted aminopeptidase
LSVAQAAAAGAASPVGSGLRWPATALLLVLAALGAGCSHLGYYGQAVAGHLDVLHRAQPVADLIADPATPPALRERLVLAQRMRDFAVTELALPDNRSYRSYSDLQRPAVVWNVVAAPELSLTLKTWCFPVAGCVGYRGYFDRRRAQATAAQLRAAGYDVLVYPVPAYSTLGRLDWLGGDPLLSTFIGWPEGQLARLIFHELAHQVLWVRDDMTFNESFASAVDRLGVQRWLAVHGSAEARAAHARFERRRAQLRALVQAAQGELEAVYASGRPAAEQRAAKAAVFERLRAEHRRLREGEWGGFADYAAWFADANNAALGIFAAYDDLVPGFEGLYRRCGGDFACLHRQARQLADLPKDERHARLRAAAQYGALPPPLP